MTKRTQTKASIPSKGSAVSFSIFDEASSSISRDSKPQLSAMFFNYSRNREGGDSVCLLGYLLEGSPLSSRIA